MTRDTEKMPTLRPDASGQAHGSGSAVEVASGRSHVGRVRDDNQDRMYVGEAVFAVADGMGGHRAGAVAAETALGPVVELDRVIDLEHDTDLDTDLEIVLRDTVMAANTEVLSRAQADPSCRGMGTTVTAMVIEGARAHLAYVGDSRAYLLREGALQQLTIDHTLVQRLVDAEAISPEQAAEHPQSSVITRGIGLRPQVEVDVVVIDIEVGDIFVLCSDGLTAVVDDDTITDELARHVDDVSGAADALIARALEGGAPDNVTVVVVRIDEVR